MIALLAAVLITSAKSATVSINGIALPASAVATVGGRTFVALRAAGSALNADVAFNLKTKTATFTTVVRQVVMKAGYRFIVVNGLRSALAAAPVFVNNRMLVPLRALAIGLGATIRADAHDHAIAVTSSAESAGPSGGSSARSSAPLQTLQGTVTRVDSANEEAAVYISVHGDSYRIALPAHAAIQFRETRGDMAGAGTIDQVRAGDTLIASFDSSGGVISVADIFTGYLGTIAAIAGSSMVLTSGRVVNGDQHDTLVSLDGRPAQFADLQPTDAVTVRADPLTGEVRDIVAASAATDTSRTSAMGTDGTPVINSTQDNAGSPLRAGQILRVSASGSPGIAASFDIGDMIVGVPMSESRPGRYDGAYSIDVGTNLVAAPVIVRFARGASMSQAVAPDAATIITTPPSVRDVEPASGVQVNSRRPSVFVTFATLGERGMLVDSERLWVNGVEVTPAATRNSSYIAYQPNRDLDPGAVRVELRATDTAGNPLSFAWSFEISGS